MYNFTYTYSVNQARNIEPEEAKTELKNTNDKVHVFSWAKRSDNRVPELEFHDGIVIPSGKLKHFTPEECEKIIALADKIESKQAITGDGGNKISYDHRRSYVRQFYPDEDAHRWIFERVEQVVEVTAKHFGFNLTGFYEGAQYYEYPEGGYLDPHMDIAKGRMSTRKLGVSVQLSDPSEYDGGDLEFISSSQKAPRELGSVIVFPAYMMHGVTKVTRGLRKCLVTWVHGQPFC